MTQVWKRFRGEAENVQKKIIDDATLPVTAIHVLFLIIKILKQAILVIKAVKIQPRLPSTLVMVSSYYV